jgi:hypothetical protein
LHINVEYQVFTLGYSGIQRTPVCAVIIAEHFGILQELAKCNALFKFRARDKVIAFPAALVSAGGTCGVGDREFQAGDVRQQPGDQRGFTRP